METPKSAAQQTRSMRNHTPRLSERKKKLFDSKLDNDDEDLGLQPLSVGKSKHAVCQKTPKSTKNSLEALMGSSKKTPRVISFFEIESDEDDGETAEEEKPSPSTRRSVRLSRKKVSPNSSKSGSELSSSPHKENIPVKTPSRKQQQEDKQLQKMFNTSMQITPREKTIVIDETSSEEDEAMADDKRTKAKRNLNKRCVIEASTGLSPMRKVAKKSTSPLDSVAISTKSFYSGNNKISPANTSAGRSTCRNLFAEEALSPKKYNHYKRADLSHINKGVRHKIKRKSSASIRHFAPVDIDRILSTVRNEKLRKLITSKREEKQQIEKIHNIFRQASNPIAMAKPLSALSAHDDTNNNNVTTNGKQNANKTCYDSSQSTSTTYQLDTDFSDIECDSGEDDEFDGYFQNALNTMNDEVIPIIRYDGDDALSVKSDDAVSVCSTKRKFFTSGRQTTTKKEVKITGNIRATVKPNGKLRLVQEKRKVRKRLKIRNSVASEFSDEQATVDAILRNLDDTAFGDIIITDQDGEEDNQQTVSNGVDSNANDFLDEIDLQLSLMDEVKPPTTLISDVVGVVQPHEAEEEDIKPDFSEFINRLPYNTSDPEIIERQQLLLDFLITNNICTEKNFTIFIADPDNHKTEAERIIDELVMVVTGQQHDFRHKIPYNTTDPVLIAQQQNFLDFLEENSLCTEENFDIFIASYEQRKAEADAILEQYMAITMKCEEEQEDQRGVIYITEPSVVNTGNTHAVATSELGHRSEHMALESIGDAVDNSAQTNKLYPLFYPGGCQPLTQPPTKRKQQQRSWNAGYGSDQYQIDAGQKAFGAHQCKQCGLVYTAHEPEEEKLHRDFHASLHVLRFKGWIDEDIMAIYPEWGPDGRIIRLTESSALKRKERLMDVLKIVDKELGFSSYIVPKTFVAYFAVRKMQIVGLCLVQPLSKASKYLNINGVDCCTDEQFEAKCGISRIWVSPLHRRFHIASKLIQAVQLNTIYGEEIPLDKIAFSAPTEMGRAFAQKITETENFLVYQ